MTPGSPAVGVVVAARRQELGLSVRAAAVTAGVSRATWTAMEAGTRRLRDTGYAGVERALRWPPGTVAALAAGAAGPVEPVDVQLIGSPEALDAAGTSLGAGYTPAWRSLRRGPGRLIEHGTLVVRLPAGDPPAGRQGG